MRHDGRRKVFQFVVSLNDAPQMCVRSDEQDSLPCLDIEMQTSKLLCFMLDEHLFLHQIDMLKVTLVTCQEPSEDFTVLSPSYLRECYVDRSNPAFRQKFRQGVFVIKRRDSLQVCSKRAL